jgi:polyhydroxybutyrate depolymerase
MKTKSPWTLSVLVVAACSSSGSENHETPSDAGVAARGDAGLDASGGGLDDAGCATGTYDGGVPPGPWSAGDYPPGITAQTWLPISGVQGQQGLTRQYKVHVPPGYTASAAAPIVFCFHGLDQDGVAFCTDSGVGWNTKSDQEGFVLVIPNGYQQSWNGGSCCGTAASMNLDDVSLVRAIFAEVAQHVSIDSKRVYATGYSTGAYMSYRLACEASDLVTAVAPSAGEIGIPSIGGGTAGLGGGTADAGSDFPTCAPTQPVSVLDIHGTSDMLIPYSLQPKTLALAAMNDGCSMTTAASPQAPPSGGDTTCVTYSGCASGIEVSACSIQGGGHCWFGSPDCGTGAAEVLCSGGTGLGGLLGGGASGLGALAGLLGDGGIDGIVSSIVGNNSNYMKNTDQAWAFFSRHSR